VLRRLLGGADVFIQGYRPGVMDRLGFGYEAVAVIAPSIVYLSVSGFGQIGPLAERPAMDPVLQAFTGLTNENVGEDGIPHRVPIIAVDMSCGLYAFAAVAPALYARSRTGKGRHLAVSLLEAGACLQAVRMLQHHLDGGRMRPPAGPSGVYRCADGWINVTVARQHEWVAFCEAAALAALVDDPRFSTADGRSENADAMRALLRPVLARRSFAEWSERFAAKRVMHERVNSYSEFLAHPQVAQCGAVSWVAHPDVPAPLPLPNLAGAVPFGAAFAKAAAPRLGQHTEQVLREYGYTDAEIDGLAARSVIGRAEPVSPPPPEA
jgi:crotonobetainyl-CoA:carnitine CoA-transferase CaiB-like acyl-CoA transferase